MSLTSWLHVPQIHRTPAPNKPSGRKSWRQPTHSRPSLEYLEERMMLDAGASNGVLAGADNPTFNSAQASNGVVLPTTSVPFQQTTALTNQVYPNAAEGIALAATDAPLAVDQTMSQFRSFGVNSQGTDLRQDLNWQMGILITSVYGFGSGTAPNAPWMPNAYNLGLANHQFGYPSQSDMGFGPTPPWASHVAQSQPKEQNPSLNLDLKNDEQEAVKPDEVLVRRSAYDEEQPQPAWMDKDMLDRIENSEAPLEQQMPQKQPSLDRIVDQEGAIPDSVWLSALAPAPMAALVAGLPGIAVAAEAESCDAVGEAAE